MKAKRKIKIWSIATMDGYVSQLNGDTDFITEYPNLLNKDYGFGVFYDSIAYAMMNRTQYINSNGLWSMSEAGKPCYVVTRDGFSFLPSQNIEFIFTNDTGEESIISRIQELQNDGGLGDIWLIGNHELISLLIRRKMIDEITVNIVPVTLGSGIPLFSPHDKVGYWKLLNQQEFDNGVSQITYRVRSNI